MIEDVIESQQSLVRTLISMVEATWEHIVCNVEIKPLDDEEIYVDCLALVICSRDGALSTEPVRLNSAMKSDFGAIRRAMMTDDGNRNWTGFELRIDRPDRFAFDFTYDPPKRVEGLHDHQSYFRFDTYLDDYKKRLAAVDS